MSAIPRKFWVLLAVSAALNLFFLGLFAGRLSPLREHRERDGRGMHGERNFLRRSGLLDAGPEVADLVRAHRAKVRDDMRSVHEARKRAKEAMRAEPFNPEHLRSAFDDVRARTTDMQSDMHGVLNQVAGKLNPKQRERLSDALWRGGGRWSREVQP